MNTRPILFSAPMVRALLDGSKTQTRRPVKGFALELLAPDGFTPEYVAMPENHNCPFGYQGDHIWVRETFYAFGRWETRFSEKKKRDEWNFVDMTDVTEVGYQFEKPACLGLQRANTAYPTWWKRPSIFMPRQASRILLEIVSVRVERLNDCSEADAKAEGAPGYEEGVDMPPPEPDCVWNYRRSYERVWEAINGPGSWAANPWVWVVEFKRVPL